MQQLELSHTPRDMQIGTLENPLAESLKLNRCVTCDPDIPLLGIGLTAICTCVPQKRGARTFRGILHSNLQRDPSTTDETNGSVSTQWHTVQPCK